MRAMTQIILGYRTEMTKQARLVATVATMNRVKDKDALVVQVSQGEYNVYAGASVDDLRRIFPGKPIYSWSDNLGWAVISE